MTPAAVGKLKKHEDGRMAELGEELRTALEAGGTGAAARKRVESVQRRLFAPLTAGVHIGTGAGQPAAAAGVKGTDPFVSAFVLSDASAADLSKLGARVRSKAGDVFSALVPLSAIPQLEASPAIRYLELARPLAPALDEALPAAQITTLQGPPASLTGLGVIVGVVDSVLDVYHPDFRDATGASRVLFLWDQFLTPQAGEASPPSGAGLPGFAPSGGVTYGVEYATAAINTELNTPAGTAPYQTVRHGGSAAAHGTHVTGIAAGNGLGQAGAFVGAAPEAGIIFVSPRGAGDTNLYSDNAFVADAFAYIFARAAQLGLPCVVNLSSSDNQGPHDGTTLGEQFLDNLLLTPGRAITTSSGNSTGTAAHAAGTVAAGGSVNLVLNYQLADVDGDGDLDAPTSSDDIEIWYDGHDQFTVTVTAPTTPATIIGPVAPGAAVNAVLPGGIQVQVTSVLNDPRNGDNLISIIMVVPPGQQVPLGNWTINLAGTTVINGRFDAWVDRNNRFNSSFLAPFLQENQTTLGVPSTARRVITVGNHNKTLPTPGISPSSGRGPTRDGRIKPEIATVGTQVTAARSRNMALANPGNLYVPKTGTSMSSPLVAGTCALLFQCRGPMTTWANLKQILEDTAGTAGIAVPGTAFGFGYMQVANACGAPAPNADAWLRDDLMDQGVEPYPVPVYWHSPDIEVLNTAGNPVANPTHHPTARFNNLVRVTVRNRGTQTVRNVEVYLYWADPATNIPFPSEWRSTGMYTGAPDFLSQGNVIAIPQIAAGQVAEIQFAWAPPAPASNLRGDDHFCLLARVEAESDPSSIGAGGWSAITDHNNLALRNVHVQAMGADGDAESRFYVVGSDDQDSLRVTAEHLAGEVGLVVPLAVLPWRDLRMIERYGLRREFGIKGDAHPLAKLRATLKGDEIEDLTDVTGATMAEVAGGVVTLWADTDTPMIAPLLRIVPGARMPAGIRVRGAKLQAKQGVVHVGQLSGGRFIGGVTLEVRRGKRR
jgi:subtilisin family serine protease